MEWSSTNAMGAYLNTIELWKIHGHQAGILGQKTSFAEPKCMEFISALAAGNGAKLLLQVTSEGATPITLALAVAAKQTGGKLICILPQQKYLHQSSMLLQKYDLKDAIKFIVGNPSMVIKQYKRVDFLVVDSKYADVLDMWKAVDFNNLRGSVVTMTNKIDEGKFKSIGEILEKLRSVECVTLPIGEGVELTKVCGSCCKYENKRCKRFLVTFENK